MLADGEVFAKVSELIKAKDKTLWQTIKDFFTNLAAKIKSAYAKLEPDSIEGRRVADMLDTAEELKTLWAEALVEASGVHKESLVNNDTAEPKTPDIKFSERYSYEALTSKPDMKLTTVDSNVPKNRADVVVQAKKNAAEVGKFNLKDGSVSVHVDDIGKDVVVSTGGLRHGLDRRFDVNAPVTVKAGEILKNSIRINEMTPDNDNAESSYVLIGATKNEKGELYIVRSIVNSFKSELVEMDTLYAINAKTEPNLGIKKGNQAGAYPQGTPSNDSFLTDSTISISQLLDFVNRYFPDILPESVLRHYGYDARPEGELGESALYSDRNPDAISNRALLANALESVVQNDIERNKLNEYKKKISLIESEQAKLAKLNGQIKELSFAKGKRDTEAIKKLQLEATQTANRINTYDRQLLNLESTAALKGVLNREKQVAYKRA